MDYKVGHIYFWKGNEYWNPVIIEITNKKTLCNVFDKSYDYSYKVIHVIDRDLKSLEEEEEKGFMKNSDIGLNLIEINKQNNLDDYVVEIVKHVI